MKRNFALLLALLMLIALFSGCGGSNDTDTEQGQDVVTPDPIIEYTNPLTGEVSETDMSTTRPYCVMINNIQVAQPQCSISEADIIYEILVEGSCTRMMAMFTDISDAGAFGSMRSVRPYYVELVRSYDGILVHAGGSEQAYSDIASFGLDNIDGVRGNYADTVFYRDNSRMSAGFEHSLFTTAEKITNHVASAKIRTEHAESRDYGFTFAEDAAPADGTAAGSIVVSFDGAKTTTFTYDETIGAYTAAQFGKTYADGNNGAVPQFENILILAADTAVVDDYARREIKINTSGTGYFACGGVSIPIQWSHSAGGDFEYTLADGTPLTFGVGKTYVCFVQTSGSSVTMQ